MSGSGNRLRGTRVAGALLVDGSDAVLLNHSFCGSITIEGSGTVALGNAGMAPVPEPSGGC